MCTCARDKNAESKIKMPDASAAYLIAYRLSKMSCKQGMTGFWLQNEARAAR